jgi:hypothetical protein
MSDDEIRVPGRPSLPESLLTIESVEGAALIYCEAGLKTIPIHAPTEIGGCSCGKFHEKSPGGSSSAGKHPIQPHWQKKTLSFDEIRDQFARLNFNPNIGLVLGQQPNGLYLIAVDVDDFERFAELEAELGSLPPSPRCDSGRGYRLFYSAPPEIDVKRLVNVTGVGSEPGIKRPGVDVKVEGGQVVVAPSLHANGKRYKWTVAGEIAPLPMQWTLELVKKEEPAPKWAEKYTASTLKGAARTRAERYLEVAVTGEARALAACVNGMRNNTLFKSACRVFDMCLAVHLDVKWQWVHDEMLRAARAAGLAENESLKTLASADRTIRESGKHKVPAALAEPDRQRSSTALAPRSPEAVVTQGAPEGDWVSPPVEPPQPRKQDVIVTTELLENVNEVIYALRSDDNIYQREKKLVYITRVSKDQSTASAPVVTDDGKVHYQLVEGTPQICEMAIPTVRERLTDVVIFKKWVEKHQAYTKILPTDEIVSAVHKRGQWNGIRSLVGVVETPTMRPDGSIVQNPGYDTFTHYLYMPSEKFTEVKDEMCTQANARFYLNLLTEAFVDFPYVNDAHRMVPVAAILTLLARPAILGSIPAFLFDASTRGSGKTLQTDAIATITTGRGAPRMNYSSDDMELEKILAGYALKGSTFICLDNIPSARSFGGGPIDRVITAKDDVDLRVLGATKVLTLPWRALLMATGNNIGLHGDTARRVLMARLEPAEQNPERRTKFVHDDLLGWIRAQRTRLVSGALLILRAYILAKQPDMGCIRWGSFEEWARLIPAAIKFAGGADPMDARPEAEEEVDVEFRSIQCFINRVREILGDTDFRISSVIELLYKSERKRDKEGNLQEDHLEDLRDAIDTLVGRRGLKHEGKITAPDPVELGKRLGAFRGRVIDGLRLISKTGSGGVMRWKIVSASESVVGTSVAEKQIVSHEEPGYTTFGMAQISPDN